MQADQTVYLHPGRDRPRGPAMEVGRTLPDVVLEVDHTTDAYRRKIELYEEWGFPELWVEVPEAPSPSRPKRKVPGLRVHVLNAAGRFEERAASAVFVGWTATEIHRALNEEALSAETTATLRRIGRTLGEREGTTPDDSPFLAAERAESHAQGRVEGRTEGRVEGRTEERREMLQALVAVRFGPAVAKTLAPLLADADYELLARFSARLLQGAAEGELFAIARGLAKDA